jgi:hypothetical protein
MDIKKIITEIEKTDDASFEQVSSRRDVFSSFGSKVALAALPFALGSLFSGKASAQTTGSVIDVLNFLLELEFMQHTYYVQGVNTVGLIPPADKAGFATIAAQDKAHVLFLEKLITDMGGVSFKPKYYGSSTTVHPYVPAAYDFTMGGKYTPFSDYATFLTIAQVLEDTEIHALQGQIQLSTLQADNATLAQVMSLQATEGRHAAYVRLMRRLAVNAPETPTPWIQNNIPPTIPFQPYYVGEDNLVQKDINIHGLQNQYYNGGQMPQIAATGAFDEAYEKNKIVDLIAPFKKL